jgi:hypothetical protein
MDIEKLKYPIGTFNCPDTIPADLLNQWKKDISIFPSLLREATEGLNDQQLNTTYRPDGWTLRQVVHHCADSHMNGLTRFKLALTEEQPTIRPYMEARWAELDDSRNLPVQHSLQMLDIIHLKWTYLLDRVTAEDLAKTFLHPQYNKIYRLDQSVGNYAWHGRHHLAHIVETIKRHGW